MWSSCQQGLTGTCPPAGQELQYRQRRRLVSSDAKNAYILNYLFSSLTVMMKILPKKVQGCNHSRVLDDTLSRSRCLSIPLNRVDGQTHNVDNICGPPSCLLTVELPASNFKCIFRPCITLTLRPFNSTSSRYVAFRGRGNIVQVLNNVAASTKGRVSRFQVQISYSHSLNSYRTFCVSLF